jgi:electron transfer flavoprotein beta subunit
MNPFDENALEAALKIKDSAGASITVLSMGRSLARPIVKKSMATGADDLILLEDETFADLDSYATANVIAAAIRKIGAFDLILCGREAADTDAGQVGLGIAGILNIPGITLAGKIEVQDNKLKVERIVSDGCEVLEAPLPALVTVSSEVGTLRTANMAGIMAAQKKPVTVWKSGDLGVDPSQFQKAALARLYKPVHETKCEVIKADTPQEAGVNLALKLREAKVI